MQRRGIKRVQTDVDQLREGVLQSMNSDMQIRDALRIENAELQENNDLLLQFKAEREEEISRLEKKMAEISARCAEKEDETLKNRSNSDAAAEKTAKLEAEYSKKSEELKAKYDEESEKISKKMDNAKVELDEINAKIVFAKKKHETLSAEYDLMKKDMPEIDAKIEEKSGKIKEMDVEIEKRKKDLLQIEVNVNKQNVENARLENLAKGMKNEIQILSERKDKADREANLAEHELRKANTELVSVQNKMFSLIKRENRVNELVPQIKELCERIGIDPKL